ncbi:MAG: hypothetical protein KGJ90_06510 [Patescibacteria group bacterium]|nr:hypothetical protein [Patescibacteria group bacterium]
MISLIGVILGGALGYSLRHLWLEIKEVKKEVKKTEVVAQVSPRTDKKESAPDRGKFVDPVSVSERLEQAKTPEDLLPQNRIDFPWE